jgi:hypothetical protein
MLKLLASAGVGCYIGSNFVGALAYANEVVIAAATAATLMRIGFLQSATNMHANTTFLSTPINLNIWSLYRIIVSGFTTSLANAPSLSATK